MIPFESELATQLVSYFFLKDASKRCKLLFGPTENIENILCLLKKT